MPVTNKLKKQVDLPIWEWVRFVPNTNNVATSVMTTADDGSSRYIYHMYNNQLWRYDTISDMWHYLQPCPITPATVLALKYSKHAGNRARVLGTSGSNKIITQYLAGGNALVGVNLEIVSGLGANQVRTISAVSDEIINDSGMATTATALLITDTAKNWKTNQWIGYTCRVTFGLGWSTQRTIIANTNNTLYFNDTTFVPYEPFDNVAFASTPSATAGSQSHFTILSQEITVSSNFTVVPNANSRILVETGAIWMITSLSGSFYFYMYDVLNDMWIQKTSTVNLLNTTLATDVVLERTGKITGVLLSGTASAGGSRTLTDSTKSMTLDRYNNYQIRITGGTGMGQRRRIQANGTNYFEVAKKWDVNPDATSTYEIYPSTENIYMMGHGNAAMFVYNIEADLWAQGQLYDYGVTSNITAKKENQLPFGISTGVRNTGGILTVAINAAGANYRPTDIITISGGGGTNGKVQVETVSATGAVTSVSLLRPGATYAVTTGAAVTGGSGTGLTINILTIGVVGYITTTMAHQFKIGDTVNIAGCSEAAWNGNATIIGSDAIATFDIVTTATANMAPTASQTTSLVVDAAANWDVNEHAGRLVCVQTVGVGGSGIWRRILSNTATTLTLQSVLGTAAVTGTSRYLIQEYQAFGGDNQFQLKNQWGFGAATSGSTTTIVDNTKNWIPGSWVNYRVRIEAGTGLSSEMVITANDATTLTFAAQTFTVDTTTRYKILDTTGIATATGSTTAIIDSTKNWKVNQWAGKRVRITSGTGYTSEVSITSNTANTLNLTAAVSSITDTSTVYTILGLYNMGAGINLSWLFGNGLERYILNFRGGASGGANIYDIATDTWEYNIFYYPQAETFTTGTMYAYDNVNNRIYIMNGGRLMYYDVARREMVSSGQPPYGMGTSILSNRMEIVKTEDGLQFLYVMRHSGNEFWRTLLFW